MRGWFIPKLVVGLAVVLFASIFLQNGFTEEATRINIRLSARISFILFCMAFIASSIQYFFKGQFGFWLLMNRKFIGVSFALVHLIHLAFLVLLQTQYYPVFVNADITSILGGGGAYFFVVFMLLTSFKPLDTFFNKNTWKALHTLGGYWIAAVYFTSYANRSMTEWEYWPLLGLLIITIAFRVAKLFMSKK